MAEQKLSPRSMPRPIQRPVQRPMAPGQQPRQMPRPMAPGQRPVLYNNPKNYLRPDYRKAKVINLNAMMTTWGANQAKYKEGDLLISKKILQNLDESKDFNEVISQEKFKKNLKQIDDIMSAGKGQISYKFKGTEIILAEEVLDQNYIHHYKDLVWQYYKIKNKNEIENNKNTK